MTNQIGIEPLQDVKHDDLQFDAKNDEFALVLISCRVICLTNALSSVYCIDIVLSTESTERLFTDTGKLTKGDRSQMHSAGWLRGTHYHCKQEYSQRLHRCLTVTFPYA